MITSLKHNEVFVYGSNLHGENVRLGKEKVSKMVEAPNYEKVAIRGIFPSMSVLLAVQDIK